MATLRDLITDSLGEIGILAGGETPSADDSALCLRSANRLLDSWSLDRLHLPVTTRTVFDLTSGIGGYTFASTNTSTETTEDGFEGTWVDSLPPDWQIDGARGAIVESPVVASGLKAVGITSSVAGDAILYRDFPARPSQRGLLSFFLRSNAGGASVVRLRNLATGNYLNSSGAWVGSASTALTDLGVPYAQYSITFTVESSSDPRLRVQMLDSIGGALALFDTMTFTLYGGNAILIPRPVFIDHVSYIDTAATTPAEYPLTPLTEDEWAALQVKNQTSTVPTHYYYSPTYPEGTLQFWPIPTSTTLRGVIYVPTEVSQFSSLDDTITVPAGWSRMIVTNLALELCAAFKVNPPPILIKRAADSMGAVKRSNRRDADLSFDAGALIGSRRGWNIRTGQ